MAAIIKIRRVMPAPQYSDLSSGKYKKSDKT
jgi:hypothetical protein